MVTDHNSEWQLGSLHSKQIMNQEMMKEIVELFGQNKVNELKNILKLRKGFENYSDSQLEEWICGYCISSFADLCEEFNVELGFNPVLIK